ncbi:hypothetical protein ROTO_16160 [Roseovarius tolerans]|uniref:D-galactarate dehydratase n=1 Tax=Roseovarius tolerans TaxID=74031 RepID=A0A0L6CVK6_9RHOB|nr:hypothetical protein [Roseovarius tolerans]KNX41776.1 hypothetical protein ROTO_16160 [Roseovarius tolerans]
MTRYIPIMAILTLLGGCAQVERVFPSDPAPEKVAPPAESDAPEEGGEADTGTETPPPATGDLGLTVASLGTATEPGLWLKTPLVDARGRGRVTYPVNGKTVEVDLIPLDAPRGAGSRLSLAGFQALGAPLTGLPEVRVTGLGG